MNLEQLQQKLVAAARHHRPSDRVPYAFEKRIMARLAEPIPDSWAFWARALWRTAAPCVAVTLLLGAWSFVGKNSNAGTSAAAEPENFSQHFEQTMLAAVDEPSEDVW